MSTATATWLSRVAILLQFAAFWFSVPELLGERRLKAIEKGVEEGLHRWEQMGARIRQNAALLIVALGALGLVAILLTNPGLRRLPDMVQGIVAVALASLALVVGLLLEWLLTGLTRNVLRHLADDRLIRRRSLMIGAVLFALGTIVDFVGTF